MYKCRFCWKTMRMSSKSIPIEYNGTKIGETRRFTCEHCGVILDEKVLDYDKQQMKDMFI